MNKILLTLFTLLSLSAIQCTKKHDPMITYTPPVIVTPTTDTVVSKSYLALGDSYTIGQSVSVNERFPAQTVSLLRAMNIRIKDPNYIATTGWTTDNLAAAIANNNPSNDYDVVTLLIGVNDQYQRRDTSGYRMRFRTLLATACDLAQGNHGHVVVLSIPDYSVTPFAQGSDTALIHRQINEFNNINREVTAQENCLYLDITASTREALTNPLLLASDGLHPSGMEYQKWAQRLSAMLAPILR